eukprot:s686_g3.t1
MPNIPDTKKTILKGKSSSWLQLVQGVTPMCLVSRADRISRITQFCALERLRFDDLYVGLSTKAGWWFQSVP